MGAGALKLEGKFNFGHNFDAWVLRPIVMVLMRRRADINCHLLNTAAASAAILPSTAVIAVTSIVIYYCCCICQYMLHQIYEFAASRLHLL